MYTGRDTIEWMYGKQFKAGRGNGRSGRTTDSGGGRTPTRARRWRWWARPTGLRRKGLYISVPDGAVQGRQPRRRRPKAINLVVMPFVSLAGPVFDPRRGNPGPLLWCPCLRGDQPMDEYPPQHRGGHADPEAQRLGEKFGKFAWRTPSAAIPKTGSGKGGTKSPTCSRVHLRQGREPSRWTAPEFQHAADLLGEHAPRPPGDSRGPGCRRSSPSGPFPPSAGCRRRNLTPSTATAC